jgi:CheY-like chemotaxis protein
MHTPKNPTHVLLVDDDRDEQMLFRDTFAALQYDVELSYAASFEELHTFCEQTENLPDLVFLDINMSKQNGCDCLRMLRTLENFKRIPIIMYSNSSNPDNIDECLKLGANLYVIKPSSFEKIKSVMREIFAKDWNSYFENNGSTKVLSN